MCALLANHWRRSDKSTELQGSQLERERVTLERVYWRCFLLA